MVERLPGKIKASPNTSRKFDADITPSMIDEADRQRARWRNSLRTFAEECGHVIDRDNPMGAAIVPMKFSGSQIYIDNLINSIAAFNVRRTTDLHRLDRSTPISPLPIETVPLKARKVMWSTYFAIRNLWLAEFHEGHNGLTMAHVKGTAVTIGQIATRFLDKWEINNPLLRRTITRDHDELIEWDHDSRILVKTAGSKSDGSSQGHTYHFVHLSELSRYEDDSAELSSATTAAASFREIHCESTAHGDGVFKDLFSKAMWLHEVEQHYDATGSLPPDWNGKYKAFWAWHQDDGYRLPLSPNDKELIRRTMDSEEKKLLEAYDLDLEQLAWRRKKIAGECSDQREFLPVDFFRQEYPSNPEEAFLAKGTKAFEPYNLNLLETASNDIVKQIYKGTYKPHFMGHMIRDSQSEGGFRLMPMENFAGSSLILWDPPQPDEEFVEGVDSAEGLEERDDSAISIFKRLDPFRILEVARLISKFPPEELAEAAFYLYNLYNQAFVVSERKAQGIATSTKLVKLGCHNMYHHKDISLFSDRDDPEAFTAGFDTNRNTKSLIVGYGQTAIRDNLIILRHPEAIKQWKAYEQKDGKYNAPKGQKDDLVITDLLCLFGHQPGIAPPPGAWRNKQAIDAVKKSLPPEDLQNAYWLQQIAKIKKASREEHKIAEQMYNSYRHGREDTGDEANDPFGHEVLS